MSSVWWSSNSGVASRLYRKRTTLLLKSWTIENSRVFPFKIVIFSIVFFVNVYQMVFSEYFVHGKIHCTHLPFWVQSRPGLSFSDPVLSCRRCFCTSQLFQIRWRYTTEAILPFLILFYDLLPFKGLGHSCRSAAGFPNWRSWIFSSKTSLAVVLTAFLAGEVTFW